MEANVNDKKIFRSAILTFAACASIVFIVAIADCIIDKNTLGTTLLAAVMAGVGVLTAYLLKSES